MEIHPRTEKEREGRGFKQDEDEERAKWVKARIRACLEEDDSVNLPLAG